MFQLIIHIFIKIINRLINVNKNDFMQKEDLGKGAQNL